jgi:xanthine dehydrogenase accessory factor
VSSGDLFGELVARVRAGRPAALATRIAGPGALGAKMLVTADGKTEGGFGDPTLDEAARAFALRSLAAGESGTLEAEGTRIFVEVHAPAPRLVVVGAVHITVTLVRLAREMGFQVVVCDARSRFATPERFPDVDELILGWPNEVLPRLHLDEASYVVVVTHDAKLDNPALVAALRSPAPYVGALGSKRTHARRVAALREEGVTEEDLARIHAPIGLEIGAASPQEIALAIMAEIVAVRRGAFGEAG